MTTRFLFICAFAFIRPVFATPLSALSDLDLEPYKVKRNDQGEPVERPLAAGQRFLQDLHARSPEIASSVAEVTRYALQKEETDKFTRQKCYVLWAYGAIWGLLALFALSMWWRQNQLQKQLRELQHLLTKK